MIAEAVPIVELAAHRVKEGFEVGYDFSIGSAGLRSLVRLKTAVLLWNCKSRMKIGVFRWMDVPSTVHDVKQTTVYRDAYPSLNNHRRDDSIEQHTLRSFACEILQTT